MDSEQVCLRWNHFSSNITKNIDELWKDESLVDVTICSEGQCVQAHKIILSASSPLFKSIFAVNPCQHPVIILQDVGYQELMSIIYFVYKGEVNIQQSQLAALLKAARTLQIRGLSDSISTIESEGSQSDFSGSKKRKICEPIDEPLDECSLSLDQSLIPKIEPQLEETFISNVSVSASDEDDMKNDSLHESLPNLLPTDSGGNTDSVWYTGSTENQPSSCAAFPCPFCDRAYTCWGYRRRHIKAVHGKINDVTCRWCPNLIFTQDSWMEHIVNKHQLPQSDALQGIEILEEAIKVLHLKYDNPTYSLYKTKKTMPEKDTNSKKF